MLKLLKVGCESFSILALRALPGTLPENRRGERVVAQLLRSRGALLNENWKDCGFGVAVCDSPSIPGRLNT